MTTSEVGFRELLNLADERLGASVIAASDEFFAPAERLIATAPPVHDPGRYTDRGKWMDGWETRRRREPGHDWCVVGLAAAAVIRGVDIDTTHFRGNHPERAAVEAGEEEGPWTTLVSESPLAADGSNLFPVSDPGCWTRVRLQIHPDGGVARFRVYGEPRPPWARLATAGEPVDLAAALHGGRVVACNDACFGAPTSLLLPGPSQGMMDGWETRRRRGPGCDWVVIRLGTSGRIQALEVDTSHFKGNCPESCTVAAAEAPADAPVDFDGEAMRWTEILPRTNLSPDSVHRFEAPLVRIRNASHVRLEIHPDGGVARFRVLGVPLVAS